VALGATALGYASVLAVASFVSMFRLVAAAKGFYGLAVSISG
jgi:hypothetical protein